MTQLHLRTWRNDTHPSGDGPWASEPDKVSWTDGTTGRPCLIHRARMGALCGYVAVDPGHPAYGKHYDHSLLDDIRVHGGLTFADRCSEHATEEYGICHVPQPGQPHDVWWFGFDCAHAWDLIPDMAERYRAIGIDRDSEDVYRDVAYVTEQCELLAVQLVALGANLKGDR